ncbi:endonuclease VIII [Salinicola rhizosphaerae]|uniref:DNA-(apurinic or apyrimidinic site) lyase n=1 Tax=Salinicola rhizosphaerae TaxID=1443141 RepID=A0ABQ3DRB6_9GAMM|nr:endonuclease VIII [Salinicola rhizosphaerae]GHB09516.1 endonuclease 8 [Salinicola rhizosphaerae]
MPEGPEIRRVADRLGKMLVDASIERIWFAFDALKPNATSLARSGITAVDSWGKALLISFADDQVLYSHNQLYGVWKVHRKTQTPATRRTLRVRIETDTHMASLYSASDISLWTRTTIDQQPFLARLGPDLLTHDVTAPAIVERLSMKGFARRGLGSLLLDQRFYAGIGNYLRSEILFYAGLPPEARSCDLSDAQRQRLAHTILGTIRQAYREAGVTNRPEWRERVKRTGAGRARWRHAVFNREGEGCHACGTPVVKQMVGSRRLYRCPHCQPAIQKA